MGLVPGLTVELNPTHFALEQRNALAQASKSIFKRHARRVAGAPVRKTVGLEHLCVNHAINDNINYCKKQHRVVKYLL